MNLQHKILVATVYNFTLLDSVRVLCLIIAVYDTRDEIQEVRQTRDPIMLFKEKIVGADLATTEELKVCWWGILVTTLNKDFPCGIIH